MQTPTQPQTTFDSQVYVYQSDAGVGPLRPHGSSYNYPTSGDPPVATWRTPPAGSDGRPSTSRRAAMRLGPTKRVDEWYSNDTPFGTVLALRGRGAGDAANYGFTVLDLNPLAGGLPTLQTPRSTYHPPIGRSPDYAPPADAAWLVGLALAAAWACHAYDPQRSPGQRLCVIGPDWAIDVLAAMPGVVVHTGRDTDTGTCEAWGRRWECSRRGVTAFDVAMRLSGPTSVWGSDDYMYGDVATMTVNGHTVRARHVGTGTNTDRWDVDLPIVGRVTLSGSNGHVRRPHAGNAWLRELVGDGEPVEQKETGDDK